MSLHNNVSMNNLKTMCVTFSVLKYFLQFPLYCAETTKNKPSIGCFFSKKRKLCTSVLISYIVLFISSSWPAKICTLYNTVHITWRQISIDIPIYFKSPKRTITRCEDFASWICQIHFRNAPLYNSVREVEDKKKNQIYRHISKDSHLHKTIWSQNRLHLVPLCFRDPFQQDKSFVSVSISFYLYSLCSSLRKEKELKHIQREMTLQNCLKNVHSLDMDMDRIVFAEVDTFFDGLRATP